jgi:hypothetical protein
MSTLQKALLLGSVTTGLSTVLLGLAMVLTFPITADLPAGFNTPIIAFEFAATHADLSYLAGDGLTEADNRAGMIAGLQLDMAFPFAYGGFLFFLLARLVAVRHLIALLGIPFSILIIPLDIRENLTLLAIIDALANTDSLDQLLLKLRIDTWLKWGAIGVAMAALAVACAKNREYWSCALSALAAGSIALCWGSGSMPMLTEIMSVCVLVFFLFFTVKECRLLWSGPP